MTGCEEAEGDEQIAKPEMHQAISSCIQSGCTGTVPLGLNQRCCLGGLIPGLNGS